jgi:hypothetical protein
MKFWATKEEEILSAMHRVLTERGYVQTSDGDQAETWAHPDLPLTVELGYAQSTHDPIVAAVPGMPDGRAWNGKGLAIVLDAAEDAAREAWRAKVAKLTRRSEIE